MRGGRVRGGADWGAEVLGESDATRMKKTRYVYVDELPECMRPETWDQKLRRWGLGPYAKKKRGRAADWRKRKRRY